LGWLVLVWKPNAPRTRYCSTRREIGEAYKRFDRVLRQFQRMGYGNRDILLDATGGGMPLRVGAALAAMMRNVKKVHQRVRGDR
jgi:hypothetical protein